MFTIENSNVLTVFTDGNRRLRIAFVTESIARITFTQRREFKTKCSMIVTADSCYNGFTIEETAEIFEITTSALKLVVSKETGAISYFDNLGKLLLRESECGGKSLTPKKVYRNIFKEDATVASGQSIDGARAAATEFETVFDRDAFEAKLKFQFETNEAIFGLGSHEEGNGNLRGKELLLYQQNMKIVVPYFVSTRGYGVLLDCGSLMTFHDDSEGACWWADVVDELDYYFIAGGSFDTVTKNLHELTGKAPMLPKWAFGFAQSKERYVNADELLEVAREYRRREIPLDLLILDWKSWPNGAGWGQKSFDPTRFPNPQALTDELHSLGVQLMVSIWPIMTGDCPNQKELQERNLMLGNQSTYNAFLPEARETYWRQAQQGLFDKGVDAWWCDCTEPFEADWLGENKLEPNSRMLVNTEAAKKYMDHAQINTYSLPHSQGIYEGQRSVSSAKRVVNLTRSGYAGQHRYSTICWNGDICATWQTLRNCIPEGVNFCATGEPFWTVDIGGFFINNDPKLWFWRGDYTDGCRGLTDMNALDADISDAGCRDLGFWELYTRWVQYGAFLPMFRSHGTDAAREIWRFGEEGNPFYDAIAKFIRLRYQMIPYIYSLAAKITLNGTPMLRAVALDFPNDVKTHHLVDEFLFGPSLLVCPVTTPMYYEKNSMPIADAKKSREVYLPAGTNWIDFWTNEVHEGGQTLTADAPLDKMPLYIKAGSILPIGSQVQYTLQVSGKPLRILVYPGANGNFELYEDEGDNYNYEKGQFSKIIFNWNDVAKTLTIYNREGSFADMQTDREFDIILVKEGFGGLESGESNIVSYKGSMVQVIL